MNSNGRTQCIITLILWLCVFTGCTTSQRLVQNDEPVESIAYSHTLTFMAYGRGVLEFTGKKSVAGHISLSIDYLDVWGFWPSRPGVPITNPGLFRHTNYADEYSHQQEFVEFAIDETTYMHILNFMAKWEHNPPLYFVPFNDCVNLVYQVCNIAVIKYNELALLPMSAIREIRRLNEQDVRYVKSVTD